MERCTLLGPNCCENEPTRTSPNTLKARIHANVEYSSGAINSTITPNNHQRPRKYFIKYKNSPFLAYSGTMTSKVARAVDAAKAASNILRNELFWNTSFTLSILSRGKPDDAGAFADEDAASGLPRSSKLPVGTSWIQSDTRARRIANTPRDLTYSHNINYQAAIVRREEGTGSSTTA